MKTINELEGLMNDKTFRANLVNDPDTYALELGYIKTEGVGFKVHINTKSISHYIIPHYETDIAVELTQLQAGKTSTAGSASTAGTALTIFSTVSSVATVGSASTAACTNDVNIS